MLQLGSSIKYLHKGDNFLNLTLQNEFGIKLYGGKGALYHPSVFLHWELYMLFLKSNMNDTHQFHSLNICFYFFFKKWFPGNIQY